MKITAEVVEASVSPQGYHLVTLKLVFPRIVLPEFLTHREWSRSFSSNRAMPLSVSSPLSSFTPMHWGKAQRGMQSKEQQIESPEEATHLWSTLRRKSVETAQMLESLGLHKQTVNRVLEPFQWCVGVATACGRTPGAWPAGNFLALRTSMKVEPHMYELAWCIADAINGIVWQEKREHIPFVSDTSYPLDERAMASAMRCARVSYGVTQHLSSLEEDAKAARDKLMAPGDLHGSPFEHQAFAEPTGDSGNLFGDWFQFRKTLPNEISFFDDNAYRAGRQRVL